MRALSNNRNKTTEKRQQNIIHKISVRSVPRKKPPRAEKRKKKLEENIHNTSPVCMPMLQLKEIKSFLVQFIIFVSDIRSLISVMENTKIENQRRINSVRASNDSLTLY